MIHESSWPAGRVVGLAFTVFLLVGCGGATTSASQPIATGDPRPDPAVCTPANGWRWLASDPHVPLALSGPDVEAGLSGATACCTAWSEAGATWTAVDRWGAPAGEFTVTGGEAYDLTQCLELELDREPDAPSVLVRGERPWRAPPSAAWAPSEIERAALVDFASALDRMAAAPDNGAPASGNVEPMPPLAERVVFFQIAGDPRDERATTRLAAIGGRALAIAELDSTGAWTLSYLDVSWGVTAGPGRHDVYRVLAVFDLDGDGFPEVIVHRNEGPAWDDVVLRCDHESAGRPWRVVAESVGGATS